MKKICVALLGITFIGFASYGQIEIRTASNGTAGPDDLSGTTVTLNVTEDGTQVFSFFVINTTATSMPIQVERYVIDQVPNWTDQFCWGSTDPTNFQGGCHPYGLMPTNPWTCNYVDLDPLPIKGSLLVDIYNNGPGCGHYRYTMLVNNVRIDSIDVIVCSSLGLDEQVASSFTVFPNPTTESIQFKTTEDVLFESYMISDITGKTVQVGSLTSAQTINVRELLDGVYHVTLLTDKGLSSTQRFSIKH